MAHLSKDIVVELKRLQYLQYQGAQSKYFGFNFFFLSFSSSRKKEQKRPKAGSDFKIKPSIDYDGNLKPEKMHLIKIGGFEVRVR